MITLSLSVKGGRVGVTLRLNQLPSLAEGQDPLCIPSLSFPLGQGRAVETRLPRGVPVRARRGTGGPRVSCWMGELGKRESASNGPCKQLGTGLITEGGSEGQGQARKNGPETQSWEKKIRNVTLQAVGEHLAIGDVKWDPEIG